MNERPNIDQIKAELAAEILRFFGKRKPADAVASEQSGLADNELARLRAGRLDDFSVDRLIDILNGLNHRVSVYIAPVPVERANPRSRNPLFAITERMAAIDANIPPEEWDRVPTDLAQNLDHYPYGAKKTD